MRSIVITSVKIVAVRNSAGVLLLKDILAKLRVDKGDLLHFVEATKGFELMPNEPDFETQMALSEGIMREDRDILRKLVI